MESLRFDFEFLQPNMFGMIRSARARLHGDSAEASMASAKRSGSIRGTFRSSTSRTNSENVAAEKPQVSMAPTVVLGDATNTYCPSYLLGQRPTTALAEPHMPAKPQYIEQRFVPSTGFTPPPTGDMDSMDFIALHQDNPQHVAEYVQDVFHVLKHEETINAPSPTYMDRQVYINAKMRAILIDWLVDVHKKYKLRSETFFLAVNILDRFLEVHVTTQRHLQLIGLTALWISAKFEEIYPPQLKDFVYVTDKAYTKEDLLKMEVVILTALQFKILRPTALQFLDRYQSINGCTDVHRDLAQYLLELALVDYKMLRYTSSHLAAASILLSNKLLRRPSWTQAAVRHTKMTEAMLKDCAKEMCVLLECAETSTLQAVRKKYSQPKHHAVAKLNFHVPPGTQSSAPATSARERRVSTSSMTGRRTSTGGTVDIL